MTTPTDYATNCIPEQTPRHAIVAEGETAERVADALLDTYPPEDDGLDRDECRQALLDRIAQLLMTQITDTRAYYTTPSADPSEPVRHDVIVTTAHPLSSYGQPVIVDGDEATPAQQFGRALHMHWDDARDHDARDLVARANRLSGHGDDMTVAEVRRATAKFFG